MEWLLYIAIFALGVVAGYVLHSYRNRDSRIRELENHLTSIQDKYESYQQSVTAHFSHSAQLVNNLTNAYREVHSHLQQGANDLCADNKRHSSQNPAQSFLSLESVTAAFPKAANAKDHKMDLPFEPPRDYAPPKGDSDKGMLDESYGLSK
ncbi:MAG TPA: DUF1043 family protein [Agitococcus sp.]|nr:DUF1043 family protein [Agitococcus sp.]